MSWREHLLPAKLGAAEFHTDSDGGQLGRNVKLFEYPGRDKPYVEDLGRKARRFTIEAYVIASAANNNDYMPARDALIAELEKPGSKTLVHPYYGDLKVSVIEADGPRHSTREGGLARFTLTLIEAGEKTFPAAAANTPGAAKATADNALAQAQLDFVKVYATKQYPEFLRTSAFDQVRSFAASLTALVRRVTTLPAAVTDFMSALTALSTAASSLILAPQTLVSALSSLFGQLTSITAQPQGALEITRGLFEFGAQLGPAPVATTPTRTQQAANQAALVNFIEHAAIITAVQAAASMEFDSADAALALRDELIEVIDRKLAGVASDAVYYALVDVRTAMVADLQTRAAQLAKLLTLTLPQSTPATVLAYSLYGDALRDVEVLARNAIRHPNFVPSGRPLEVLSNV